MTMEQFLSNSFKATIAFGLLCLALLVIAAIGFGSTKVAALGLLACAAAYASQFITTCNATTASNGEVVNPWLAILALALNGAACGFWFAGIVMLLH
jgi:hypothetical protein